MDRQAMGDGYNESYGLGKDGIRREKAGCYENQGIQTIFDARRVPQSVLEKWEFGGKNGALKKFLKSAFKNLQSPFNSSFKSFLEIEKQCGLEAFEQWTKELTKELGKKTR